MFAGYTLVCCYFNNLFTFFCRNYSKYSSEMVCPLRNIFSSQEMELFHYFENTLLYWRKRNFVLLLIILLLCCRRIMMYPSFICVAELAHKFHYFFTRILQIFRKNWDPHSLPALSNRGTLFTDSFFNANSLFNTYVVQSLQYQRSSTNSFAIPGWVADLGRLLRGALSKLTIILTNSRKWRNRTFKPLYPVLQMKVAD